MEQSGTLNPTVNSVKYTKTSDYINIIKLNKMAKITDKQLEDINKGQKELMTIVNQIGILESQKHSLLHQVADANKVVEDLKAELEKEYGAIDIDLATGEYTEVKKDDSKLTKA